MKKRSWLVSLLLTVSISSATLPIASADSFALTREQERLIIDSFSKFSKECGCIASNALNSSTDLEKMLNNWRPLVKKNEAIFNELVNNLGRIAHIDSTFTDKNDPLFLGYLMYMLKEIAAIGAKTKKNIDHEDLRIVLNILKNSYGVQLPELVITLLKKVKHIETRKTAGQGGLSINLFTQDGQDLEIDLTDKQLLGNQEGEENLLRFIRIKNGAAIKFSSKWSGKGFDIQKAGLNFFDNLSRLSIEGNNPPLSPVAVNNAIKYFDNEEYTKVGTSPLYVEYEGLSLNGVFGGHEVDPTFVDAVVLPGAKAEGLKTFFIRSHITKDVFILRVFDETLEVAL